MLFDPDTGKVSALVIRRGLFFHHEVVLPIANVVEVVADIVRVEMDDATLKALAEYKPED